MTSTKKHIVFVDEASHEIAPFIHELTLDGMVVKHLQSAQECMTFIKNNPAVDCFVLDVMLWPGENAIGFTSENTNSYMTTGLLLAREIRELYSDTPIIFFTSNHFREIHEHISKTTDDIGNATTIFKYQLDHPKELSKALRGLLVDNIEKSTRSRILRYLDNVVEVKPSFAGISIDVKKAIRPLLRKMGRVK